MPDALFTHHGELAVLQDGRVIAWASNLFDETHTFESGCEAVNIRVPDLRMIEYVLDVEIYATDLHCNEPFFEPVNKKNTGNVVGMTIFGTAQMAYPGFTVKVVAIGSY